MFRPMKTLLTAAAAMLIASVAGAQYKTPPPATANTGVPNPGVQVAQNPNIQITPGAVQDDLSLARRIARDEAIKMVKEGKAVWVDVRPRDQYDEGHIPGAMNLPLGELMGRLNELPPGKFIIAYCA